MAKLSIGRGKEYCQKFSGGYFSKTLKTVLMIEMTNEGYFVIFFIKKNSKTVIFLIKCNIFMRISKISKSKFPKKCLFYTKYP